MRTVCLFYVIVSHRKKGEVGIKKNKNTVVKQSQEITSQHLLTYLCTFYNCSDLLIFAKKQTKILKITFGLKTIAQMN